MENITQTPVTPSTEQPDQRKLTQAEVIAAATNSPALANDSFTLGDREFKVLHLGYDSYLEFMAFLQPLLEAISAKFAQAHGVSIPGIDLPELNDKTAIPLMMKFCKKDLPAMACIVCNEQALQEERPDLLVTPEWLKKNVQDPFQVISIIFKQINKNQMISRFADFFVQILPMVGMVMGKTPTQPTE